MTSSSSTSGSSQSIQSSADSGGTLPAQDSADGNWSQTDESVWGRLYPVAKGFNTLDLKKERYQFGRDPVCDVCFFSAGFLRPCFLTLSKNHFEIFREVSDSSKTGAHVVYIKDCSSNGTYLNGQLIGKGNKQVIQNNDEIQLTKPENKAYVFINLETINQETESIPQVVKEKYTLSRVIGRGVCGEVRLAFGKGKECEKFAIKTISKNTFLVSNETAVSGNVLEEAEIMKKLDHPCIVKVIDVLDTLESLYIVLELVEGGELFHRVSSGGKLDEATSKLVFYQMLVAVKYLHDNSFTHRDLKPENVLLCSKDVSNTLIKITDFGLSKFVGEQSLMRTLCGTPMYLAPEVLQTTVPRAYKKECDCWSLGVILFICLGGQHPFAARLNRSVEQQIIAGAYSFPDHAWRQVSGEAKDLIKKLLTVDPKKRISVAKALEHPWMQDEDVVKKAKALMRSADQRKEEAPMRPPTQTTTKRTLQETNDLPPMKRQKSTE